METAGAREMIMNVPGNSIINLVFDPCRGLFIHGAGVDLFLCLDVGTIRLVCI